VGLFQTKVATFEPTRVGTESRQQRKRFSSEARVIFTQPSGANIAPTDWSIRDEGETARRLESARASGAAITVERPATGVFWLAVALTILFGMAGLFIVLAGSGQQKRRHTS